MAATSIMVMPFGLCNAPATFQRIMNTVLREGLDQYVLVFLDDILIYSRTKGGAPDDIFRGVLSRLRSEKLFGRLKKCDFFRTEVKYLGFDVGAEGIKPSLSKVRAILGLAHATKRHRCPFLFGAVQFLSQIHTVVQRAGSTHDGLNEEGQGLCLG